jgi:2-hydroxyglutarate dehydrogenase
VDGARPDPPEQSDIVVVGAGIVGLASARELLRRHPGRSLTVLDKEDRVGVHQTGHNSGVVHAGIYYKPDSLKARLCVAGARELYEFCDEKGVTVERCGKVIVALSAAELPGLDELERRGKANGVPGLRRLDAGGLRELEPHAAGVAALHSPNTGIVDFPGMTRAIAADVEAAGGRVATGCGVLGVAPAARGLTLRHAHGELRAGGAVFCAGGWADRLAVKAGAPADPRIVPFRGAYLRLKPERRELVRSLIYPVPDPELPFLGVHLTRHTSGDVLVGPTAFLAGARDAYELGDLSRRDLGSTLRWPGTWRMARRFWRTGIDEVRWAASRAAFAREAARYVPDLGAEDVEPAFAGVRAQALWKDGRLADDFVVSRTERAIHIRNAPSPAATSSLAIARLVADEADEALGLAA